MAKLDIMTKIVIGFQVYNRCFQIASLIGAFCFVYTWFVLSGKYGLWINEDTREGFIRGYFGLWSFFLFIYAYSRNKSIKERLLLKIGVTNFLGTILMRTLTPFALMPYPVVYLSALNLFTLGYVFYALSKSDNNGDF